MDYVYLRRHCIRGRWKKHGGYAYCSIGKVSFGLFFFWVVQIAARAGLAASRLHPQCDIAAWTADPENTDYLTDQKCMFGLFQKRARYPCYVPLHSIPIRLSRSCGTSGRLADFL